MSVVVSSEFETQKRLIKDCLINDLHYDYIGNLHDQFNKPVDEDRLTAYLYSRGYPREAVVKAVKELRDLTEDRVTSLYELNKKVYSLLRYGITYSEPGQKEKKRLHYIDWEHPELNEFAVAEELGLTLAFPTTDWDKATAGKVEATLAAKGRLIAKALRIPATPMSIDVEAGTVEFPWFDQVPDPQVVEAATVLIARIIDHAKAATRISAKPAETGGNDKYAMRCWLLRLGMIGDDTKRARRTLLKPLDGNAAGRTPKTEVAA